MNKNTKIIVTQTSWKKRIDILALSITLFLVTLTVRPDEYHVWLSVDEFPNKEKDLPKLLIVIMRLANVTLHWLSGNEYSHKRWYIYPEHYSDYVISIDDDCIYSPTMIEDGLLQLTKYPKCVCNIWKLFTAIPTYDNDIKIQFKYIPKEVDMRLWLCGNSIFPPNVFPFEALTSDNINLRSKYSLKNDETWLLPFLLKNDMSITCINKLVKFLTFSNTTDNSLYLENGLCKDENGYTNKEKDLYFMLKYTNMLEKYKSIHANYSYDKFEKLCNLH